MIEIVILTRLVFTCNVIKILNYQIKMAQKKIIITGYSDDKRHAMEYLAGVHKAHCTIYGTYTIISSRPSKLVRNLIKKAEKKFPGLKEYISFEKN